MVTAKALAGAFGKKQAEIELLKSQIAELKAGSATQAEQPPLVRQNAVSGGEDFGGGDDDESDSTDEKPAPVVAKTGDLVEITHDYNGTSNLLVTIDGESVLLELVQSPGNPEHNWTFAPHLKNSKHNLAHLVWSAPSVSASSEVQDQDPSLVVHAPRPLCAINNINDLCKA